MKFLAFALALLVSGSAFAESCNMRYSMLARYGDTVVIEDHRTLYAMTKAQADAFGAQAKIASDVAASVQNKSGPYTVTLGALVVCDGLVVGAPATLYAGITPAGFTQFLRAVEKQDALAFTAFDTRAKASPVKPGPWDIMPVTSPPPADPPPPTATQAATQTMITSSLNPAPVGTAVTWLATIQFGKSQKGTVQFMNGTTSIPGCDAVPVYTVDATVARASCTYTFTAAGKYDILGKYSGDANNKPSNGLVVQNVAP